jgi:hypothetical protein
MGPGRISAVLDKSMWANLTSFVKTHWFKALSGFRHA